MCQEEGYSFVLLTSSLPEETEIFIETYNLSIDYYFADDISLQVMIRSNPGLVLLKDAVVMGKWHYNDFPDYSEFENGFVDN